MASKKARLKLMVAARDLEIARLRGLLAAVETDGRHLWALAQISALLPNECWMTRSASVRCTDAVGGTFPNGTVFDADMCCLPCRIRAVLPDDGRGSRQPSR